MNTGLYRGVGAMDAAEKRLEAVTQNLANVRTPGFKRQAATHHAFRVGGPNSTEYGVSSTGRIDLSQGDLQRTGNELDLGFLGTGFFEVEGPNGELYTRNGSFHVDDAGVLLTGDNYPVAWKGLRGDIQPAGESVKIDPQGVVTQGANKVGELKLVDFNAPERLRLTNAGYFLADPALARTDAQGQVHQGSLEGSNASGVNELVNLITVQRSHEMAASVMKMIDQTYQRLSQQR
jgi:flagellar basal-body rod protein FlgF